MKMFFIVCEGIEEFPSVGCVWIALYIGDLPSGLRGQLNHKRPCLPGGQWLCSDADVLLESVDDCCSK